MNIDNRCLLPWLSFNITVMSPKDPESWKYKPYVRTRFEIIPCLPLNYFLHGFYFTIYGIHGQRAHSHILEELYTGLDESSVRVRVRGENSSEGEME